MEKLNTRQKYHQKVLLNLQIRWRLILSPFLFLIFTSSIQAESIKLLSRLSMVNEINQDLQGFIWLSGQQGVTRFDGENFINFSSNDSKWKLPFTWIHDVQVVNERLLMSTENSGLWLFDPQTGNSSPLNIKTKTNAIYRARFFDGKYYIYTRSPNILYRYDPKTSVSHVISENINIEDFLIHNKSLFYHNNKGVYKITPDGFITIIEASIKSVIANKEWLIIATEKDLISFKAEQLQTKETIRKKVFALTFEFNTNNFFTIGNKNHIKKYSPTLEKLEHTYSTDLKAQPRAVFHDSSGALWLASSHGVTRTSAININNHERMNRINNKHE